MTTFRNIAKGLYCIIIEAHTLDFLDYGAWIMMTNAYYVISIVVWLADEVTYGGSVCLVTPPAIAVFAGDNVSLTCTTDTFVLSWTRGITYNNALVVFQAANPVGLNPIPRTVVDGYLVNDSVGGQVVLIMNSASTAQADRYYCSCYSSPTSYSATSVTVLASKPTFSITSQITDGEPVNMKCNISFNGTADASVMITNVSGQVVAEKREPGTYPSTDLQVFNLDCNDTANSSIDQTYTCQVNLTDNSIPIYSKEMMTSVQWVTVRKVQINPVDKTRCSSGSKCAINQEINCTAEGNPYPFLFQWTVVLNGSQLNQTTNDQLLTLDSIGNYTINCTAFNMIGSITYNSSGSFETEVTVEGPPTPQPVTNDQGSNTALIAGVVVGVGGGIIVIVVAILIYIFCIRNRKSSTVCCKPDDKETRDINQSVELSKTKNGNNRLSTDNGAKKNVHSTPGVQNKGFEKKLNDEVTLVENDLYSAKSKPQIDPSDGGYASVNEIEAQGK